MELKLVDATGHKELKSQKELDELFDKVSSSLKKTTSRDSAQRILIALCYSSLFTAF